MAKETTPPTEVTEVTEVTETEAQVRVRIEAELRESITEDVRHSLTKEVRARIEAETVERCEKMSIGEIKKHLPKLYATVAASLPEAAGPGTNSGKIGFLLGVNDPFAAGTLRVYCQTAKIPLGSLPAVLPFKDRSSAAALQSYLVRAGGAGDKVRVAAAEAALAKCK